MEATEKTKVLDVDFEDIKTTEPAKTQASKQVQKKIKLNVAERLVILGILPRLDPRGSLIEMISRRHLMEKVDISIKEKKEINLRATENGFIKWDITKEKLISTEITEDEKEVIMQGIKVDDQAKQATYAHGTLYLKLE